MSKAKKPPSEAADGSAEADRPVDAPSRSPNSIHEFDALVREAALAALDASRELVEREGMGHLINCMAFALRHRVDVPEWLADRFVAAVRDVRTAKAAAWEDVFGRPHPKGAHLHNLRWYQYIGPQIGDAMLRRLRENSKTAVDKGLFEEVGAEFDMGATECEKIFRFCVAKGLVPRTQDLRRLAARQAPAAPHPDLLLIEWYTQQLKSKRDTA